MATLKITQIGNSLGLILPREIVERLRVFTTGVLESFSYIRNSGHRELLLSGLRLAMGETT